MRRESTGRRRRWVRICVVMLAAGAFGAIGCGGAQPVVEEPVVEEPSGPSVAQDEAAEPSGAEASAVNEPEGMGTEGTPAAEVEPEEIPEAEVPAEAAGDVDVAFDRRIEEDLDSAIRAARSGDSEQALSRLSALVDGPGGYLAAYNIGILREAEGKTGDAARRYQQALEKHPGFSPALLNLVRLYLRSGQPDDADEVARKFMDLDPENMSHRAVHLEVDIYKGQYEDAVRGAKEILRRDETNVDAMLSMAEANIAMGRLEFARAILDRATEIEPERAQAYYSYALVAELEGVQGAAITGYEDAIARRADFPEAHNNLGVIYHEARDYEAAIASFDEAIRWAPNFKEAHLNRGNSLKGQGKFKEAEDAFKAALAADSEFADAYFNLGILYLDSDIEGVETIPEMQQAIEYFETYKKVMGSRLDEQDPVEKYLQESKKTIEVEKQRQEMMRQQQQTP